MPDDKEPEPESKLSAGWLLEFLDQVGKESPPPSKVVTDKEESKALYGDEQRQENLKQEFHRAFIWLLRVAIVAFLLIFIVRVVHFVLPENCIANDGKLWLPHGWLTDSQLQTIDKFFFSGTLGALITKYLGPIMGKKEDKAAIEKT